MERKIKQFKMSSFKNPHIKIDHKGQNPPLSYYTL